jgi:hypothetical protein
MDSTTNLNGTNGTVVIEEKLDQTTNGVVPIIISAQEVA